VVCGHIHQPEMREITNAHGCITYLNSGDWIENLSSLEYVDGEWSIYKFRDHYKVELNTDESDEDEPDLNYNQIFDNLLQEFNLMR
jgi:hypothetical protein